MSKKVWVDLTDISSWSGHFTGIQRVVYNLALRFHEENAADYFRYDERSRKFYKADFNDVIERFTNNPVQSSTPGVSSGLKQSAIDLYTSIPKSIRAAVPTPVKSTAKLTLKTAYKMGKKFISRPAEQEEIVGEQAEFEKEDLVLVLGNNWDRAIFIEDLKIKKAQKGFSVYQLIYDLIPTLSPHLFGPELFNIYTKYLFETVAISDGLFCISKSTESDLFYFCRETGLLKPNTCVIRLGDTLEQTKSSKLQGPDHKDFVLCVGTIEVRKNHALLYYAWKEGLRRGYKMPKLVIVGRGGWHTQDIKHSLVHDPEVKSYVKIYESLGDSELKWLYENCLFTTYPSMYEGWGLPIAESLAYGKVCIASNSSSMTEIAGDLVEYFSPYDSGECVEKVHKYFEDRKLLSEKEEEISRRYKSTPWDFTYKQVKSFLRK